MYDIQDTITPVERATNVYEAVSILLQKIVARGAEFSEGLKSSVANSDTPTADKIQKDHAEWLQVLKNNIPAIAGAVATNTSYNQAAPPNVKPRDPILDQKGDAESRTGKTSTSSTGAPVEFPQTFTKKGKKDREVYDAKDAEQAIAEGYERV